jgi:hypothetical protein
VVGGVARTETPGPPLSVVLPLKDASAGIPRGGADAVEVSWLEGGTGAAAAAAAATGAGAAARAAVGAAAVCPLLSAVCSSSVLTKPALPRSSPGCAAAPPLWGIAAPASPPQTDTPDFSDPPQEPAIAPAEALFAASVVASIVAA